MGSVERRILPKLCKTVMDSLIPAVLRRTDPNGIRTRVTAVKGRCPGPLDDRVRKPGNIGIAIVRRKANWQLNFEYKYDVGPSASVQDREPAWLSALLLPGARSRQYARFAQDAGALRRLGEAHERYVRASRYRSPDLHRRLKPAF